jgi:hypothetical protein
MRKQVIWLCAVTVAIAAGSLSLPLMSMAHAHQRAQVTLTRAYNYSAPYWTRQPPSLRAQSGSYHGHFTLPEFDRDYHGSNDG